MFFNCCGVQILNREKYSFISRCIIIDQPNNLFKPNDASVFDTPWAIPGNTFFAVFGKNFVAIGTKFEAIDANIFDPFIVFDIICAFDNFKSIPLF